MIKLFLGISLFLTINVNAQDSTVIEYNSSFGCFEVIKVYRKNGSLKKVTYDNWNGQRSVKYYFMGLKLTRKRFVRSHIRNSVPPCHDLDPDTIIIPNQDE